MPRHTEPDRGPKIELLDFTKITRNRGLTEVSICLQAALNDRMVPWLRLSHCNLTPLSPRVPGVWRFSSALRGATDAEHDGAWVLRMELTGVSMTLVNDSETFISGWIRGDSPEEFRVPDYGYNPLALSGTTKCRGCKGENAHVMVPPGFYVPPANVALFERVRGCFVDIRINPTGDKQ